MKEYGILFSAPMILAILAGRKTVTRRMDKRWQRVQQGDVLWARETWRPEIAHSHGMNACDCADVNITYTADGACRYFEESKTNPEWVIPKTAATGNVSPLFMPRWASRIILEVTEDARIEPLEYLTDVEAIAEGIQRQSLPDLNCNSYHWGDVTKDRRPTARDAFRALWGTIHTKPGERWEDSPQIVRLGFKCLEAT